MLTCSALRRHEHARAQETWYSEWPAAAAVPPALPAAAPALSHSSAPDSVPVHLHLPTIRHFHSMQVLGADLRIATGHRKRNACHGAQSLLLDSSSAA